MKAQKGRRNFQQEPKKTSNQPKPNPFDTRKVRTKFPAFRKRGSTVKTSHSRTAGQKKREETLAFDYDERNKKNKFFDKRYTSLLKDESMTTEEKRLIMFQRERRNQWKDNSESYGKEFKLTHEGKALFDDEEDVIPDEDDDFGGMTKKSVPTQMPPEKTKDQIMKDLISKSKFFRAQKSIDKEKNLYAIDKLDEELDSIKGLLFQKDGDNNEEKGNRIEKQTREEKDDMETDDFDMLLEKISNDTRVQPTDALKTPEEIAYAEKERLEQLEKARIKRMIGEEMGGDDLSDDYNGKYAQDDSDNEVIDDDNNSEYNEKKIKLKDNIKPTPMDTNQKEITSLGPDEDIPYTFIVPSSYSNFKNLLQNQSVERQNIIITRIRACNHISLLPENKEKMKILYEYILKRIMELGQLDTIPLDQIDILVGPAFQLSHQMPDFSASIVKNLIQKIYKKFKVNGIFNSSDLMLFIIIPLIWPSTDKRHVVVTPTLVLMGELLSKIKLENVSDTVKGLLLTNAFINYIKTAKRFSSEPFFFIQRVLSNFTSEKTKIKNIEDSEMPQLNIKKINDYEDTPQTKIAILNTCISLLGEYLNIYTENGILPIYKMSSDLIIKLKESNLPKILIENINNLDKKINERIIDMEKSLKPLQYHLKKVAELPSFTPDFLEIYQPSLIREPDKKKRETRHLQKQLKREYKGAARELRKDSEFLERIKQKERKKIFEYKDKKRKEIFSMLEQQQSEGNKYERMKKRKLNF